MTVSERRQAIMETLGLRKKETCENLAFEFGVSIQTIYYDIDALTPYYPIQVQRGKGGGVYVEKDFKIDRKFLTTSSRKRWKKYCRCFRVDRRK